MGPNISPPPSHAGSVPHSLSGSNRPSPTESRLQMALSGRVTPPGSAGATSHLIPAHGLTQSTARPGDLASSLLLNPSDRVTPPGFRSYNGHHTTPAPVNAVVHTATTAAAAAASSARPAVQEPCAPSASAAPAGSSLAAAVLRESSVLSAVAEGSSLWPSTSGSRGLSMNSEGFGTHVVATIAPGRKEEVGVLLAVRPEDVNFIMPKGADHIQTYTT